MTGSELFSSLTCLLTTVFTLLSIFSLIETISLKIWERTLSWYANCSLPFPSVAQKPSLLKLSTESPDVEQKRQIHGGQPGGRGGRPQLELTDALRTLQGSGVDI